MAPVTRASSRIKEVSEDVRTHDGAAEADRDKLAVVPHKVSMQQVYAQFVENSSFDPYELDWYPSYEKIVKDITTAAKDRDTLFVNCGTRWFENYTSLHYYPHNGALFIIPHNGQPFPRPAIQVDPTTLGLPYDPDTNAEDAALGLTVAPPEGQLYVDAVYIKDLFDPAIRYEMQKERYATEVRSLEILSKKHPHPNFVRYLGCRVVEVPDTAGTADDAGGRRMRKRITGIVLEKLDRMMMEYDPDVPAFRDVNVDVFLKQLEATVCYLHSFGWAYNALKPSNVMLRADGQPLLIDFESCAPLGTKIPVIGTPNWCNAATMGISHVENDLYALRLFRERIRDKKALLKYFRGH